MPRFAKYDKDEEPIEGYRLVDYLGAGQFGEVWKAIESSTGKLVAVKMIDLSHSTSALKELKALNLVKNLNHPHLIPIFTASLKDKSGKVLRFDQAEDAKNKGNLRELVIVMGLADKSLSARLKDFNPDGTDPHNFSGVPAEELIYYMQGAAKGIDYLNRADHGLGSGDGPIIHCDIKPDNMMILAGEVQIADCGVAVIISPDARQTRAAGSPAYSAPELTGNKPGPGTDQYALAISYYELRTGLLPFDEEQNQLAIMMAHANGELKFRSPLIGEGEALVLQWATATQPKNRYPTCLDMVRQLERAIEGLQPVHPTKITQKSVVVPTPSPRSTPTTPATTPPPAVDDLHRSTPNYGQNLAKPNDAQLEALLDRANKNELRGTVIPGAEQFITDSRSGFQLPPVETAELPTATPSPHSLQGQSTADYPPPPQYTSLIEIEVPFSEDESFPDIDETSESPEVPIPLTAQLPPPVVPIAPVLTPKQSTQFDISRPDIPLDENDPLKGVLPRPVLSPEIEEAIRGSRPVKLPTERVPTPPPPTHATATISRPIPAPPKPDSRRSTPVPVRETPAMDEEQKSLPPWAKEAGLGRKSQPFDAKQTVTPKPDAWKPKPTTPTPTTNPTGKFIAGGLVVGGLIAGGYFLFGGSGSTPYEPPEVPPTVPTTVPTTVHTTGSSPELVYCVKLVENCENDTGMLDGRKARIASARAAVGALNDSLEKERASLIQRLDSIKLPSPPATSPSPQPLTREERFVQALSKLPSTKEKLPAEATIIYKDFNQPDEEKRTDAKLVEVGTIRDFRDAVMDALIANKRLPVVTEPQIATLISWRTAQLDAPADKLKSKLAELGKTADLSKKVDTEIKGVRDALTEFELAIGNAGKPFGARWNLPEERQKLFTDATTWKSARDDASKLEDLYKLAIADPPSDAPLAMALEYFRLTKDAETTTTLAKWRTIRKSLKDETVIVQAFQTKLAANVSAELKSSSPNFAEIKKLCGPDHANGWAKAALAEEQLAQKNTATASLAEAEKLKPSGTTGQELATYIQLIRGLANGSAADVHASVDTGKEFLKIGSARRTAAAAILAQEAIKTRRTKYEHPDRVAEFGSNTFDRNATALKYLKKANELKPNPDWVAPLTLLAVAAEDATAKQLLDRKAYADELKLTDDELPTAFAYYKWKADQEQLDPKDRATALAAACRLAFRVMELCHEGTTTETESFERTKAFCEWIEKGIEKSDLLNLNISSLDKGSLKLSKLRCKLMTEVPGTKLDNWKSELTTYIDEFKDTKPADLAEAYAWRSYLKRLPFYRSSTIDTEKTNQNWTDLKTDAKIALDLNPNSFWAMHQVAIPRAAEYRTAPTYKVPEPSRKPNFLNDRDDVNFTAGLFEKSCKHLHEIKNTDLYSTRSYFLIAAADDLTFLGVDVEMAKKYYETADGLLKTANEWRATPLLHDQRLRAAIQTQLALVFGSDLQQSMQKSKDLLATPEKATSADTNWSNFERAKTTARAISVGYYANEKAAQLQKARESLNEVEKATSLSLQLQPTVKFWKGVVEALDPDSKSADQTFKTAIDSYENKDNKNPSIHKWHLMSLAWRAENAIDQQLDKDIAKNSADALRQLLRERGDSPDEYYPFVPNSFYSFVPDYLEGRLALLNDKPRAAESFAAAYKKIKASEKDKTLRIEWPWALRCLAYELIECELDGTAKTERKTLLADLQKRFAWTLSGEDKKLIQKALK